MNTNMNTTRRYLPSRLKQERCHEMCAVINISRAAGIVLTEDKHKVNISEPTCTGKSSAV